MTRSAGTKNWVQLRYLDEEMGVMVTPENEDRFPLTMQVAIRGCKIAGQLDRFDAQMKFLLKRLHDWTASHSDHVENAYIALREQGMLFLIVQKNQMFNPDLEDELTSLDLEISENADLDLVKLSVIALPNADDETIQSFLPPSSTLTYKHAD